MPALHSFVRRQRHIPYHPMLWLIGVLLLHAGGITGSDASTQPRENIYLPVILTEGTARPVLPVLTTTASPPREATPTSTVQATATVTPVHATATSTSTVQATATVTPVHATATSTTTPANQVAIRGDVRVRPYHQEVVSSQQPRAYLVLLPVSGRMSLNTLWHGTSGGTIHIEGDTEGGTDYQCGRHHASDPLPSLPNCLAVDNPWRRYQERRIYLAKQMVQLLIDRMTPLDTMRIIAYAQAHANVPDGVQVLPAAGWSADPVELSHAVYGAGAYQNDPYRSSGGLNSAQALTTARDVLHAAPSTASDGRPYQQVVVMMSAGVTFMYADGTSNFAHDICGHIYPESERLDIVRCQIGYRTDGRARPVQALMDQADLIKAEFPDVTIHAIELSPQSDTGLQHVASDTSTYYLNPPPSVVDLIAPKDGGSSCTVQMHDAWINVIDALHTPTEPSLPDGVYGYVGLYTSDGTTLLQQAPITHGSINRTLEFSAHMPPGDYTLRVTMHYKGDDHRTRAYSALIDPTTQTRTTERRLIIPAESAPATPVVVNQLDLSLAQPESVCPS